MIIEVKDLVKRYGDLVAVDHLSLDVKEGEILGLLGPNGSGKTTVINCILSLLTYNSGEIKIFGEKMDINRNDIKAQIGVVMQEVAVLEELNVYENIDYFCGLYINDKKVRKEYVKDAIDFVGLNDYVKFKPKKLSGGLLRRLNIACGIAHKPKIIFFDEPTVAVDPQSRNSILEGIKQLNKDGATIIYTSHYMEEIELLCNDIVVMDNGKVIARGTKEELKEMVSDNEKISFEIFNLSSEDVDNITKLDNVLDVNYKETILEVRFKKNSSNLVNILNYLQGNSIEFNNIVSQQPTLNDVFLEITGKELRD